MGTTGSGRISDYFDEPPSKSGVTGGGSGSESPTEDPCATAFSALLEEVAISDYYVKLKQLPSVGESVNVQYKNNRLAVLDDAHSYIVGYLPTSRNYIRKCMKDKGLQYTGDIVSSKMRTGNVPEVTVSIIP